ncbi:MAG TPA: radical SAM family heme chaperone HemW [Thermoanaerobaculia bacterium]|nr:radical SAM family heme chaperone HemW [Thermoanaerobaculia bacterium]
MSLGIYVHLPFCRTHCSYCAFAISTDVALQDEYAEAVVREIHGSSGLGPPASEVESIYLGGGTPSRMSVPNLAKIVEAVVRGPRSEERGLLEFSMEANPEDITRISLDQWRSLGVNRISIGVQSFQDQELIPLGRVHGADAARQAVSLVAGSGVRTSLDLIAGLPNQTVESFAATLDEAIALGVGHISLYMLDLEERSPLAVQVARGRAVLPDDEEIAAMYVDAIGRLARAGFHQYEISNFAREGEECLHNLRYWRRGEYLGFGLAAHSFAGGKRFANTRDIRRYIGGSPDVVDFVEQLGEDEVRRETIFLGLRQTSGINCAELERLCGQEVITEWIDRGLHDGWLEQQGERVSFTPSGFLLSNEFISQLF